MKPGGEMVVVEKHIIKLVKRVDVDDKGRWVELEIEVGGRNIVMYCTYVPNKNDGGGPTTVA